MAEVFPEADVFIEHSSVEVGNSAEFADLLLFIAAESLAAA
jgi:hypothetical protein